MPELDLVPQGLLPEALRCVALAAPMPGLSAGPRCEKTHAAVESLIVESRLLEHTGQPYAGSLTASALWLLAGDLDASHQISQAIDSAEGSYWHGIMHRREGDYSNAKYWFRRVGQHAMHGQLVAHIQAAESRFAPRKLPLDRLDNSSSLANELVDLCQVAVHGQPPWKVDLEQICWWEWQLMLLAGRSPPLH